MSDTPDLGFGKFVPGFDFLQGLARQAAGGVVQGVQQSIPQLPNLGNWVAPTFNVEELEKRIDELKAVHFWLDQNAKALGATIQALEVQKMTLATLKGMNFSLGDVANALKIKAADSVASVAAPAPAFTPEPAPPKPRARKPAARKAAAPAAAAAAGVVDPMQWWGSLTQQFQSIAANAMKDVAKQSALDTTRHVAAGLTKGAVQTATGVAKAVGGSAARSLSGAVKGAEWPLPAPAAPATKKAARRAPARKRPRA